MSLRFQAWKLRKLVRVREELEKLVEKRQASMVASHPLWNKTDLNLRHETPGNFSNSLSIKNDDNLFIGWSQR